MPRLTISFCLIAALSLANAASASGYPPPPTAGSIVVSSEPFPLDKEMVHTSRIGESPVYLVQTSGGSLALGLLGGALINSRLIARKSAEVAAKANPRENIILSERISEAISRLAPGPLSDSSRVFAVSGALLISIDADNRVRTALMINAKDTSAPDGWRKTYFYHFKDITDASSFEQSGYEEILDKIAVDLDQAIELTSRVLVDDLSGKLPAGVAVKVQSEFLRPIRNVVMPFKALHLADRDGVSVFRVNGKPGLIRFPTIDGIHLFGADQFQLKK